MNVHFIAIGGAAMHNLAIALHNKGYKVTGSEFKEGGYFSKQILQKWSEVIKKRYLFGPHRIIQLLYNKSPEVMNYLAKPPIEVAKLVIDKKSK